MSKRDEIFTIMKPDSKFQQEKSKVKLAKQSSTASQLRIMKNVLVICFGFFFVYLPFQSMAALQSTMNVESNMGLISQAIIFTTVLPSALFLPKLIIKKFGCKCALVVCLLTFAPYVAANFYPHMGTLIPAAILLGLGGAPLWSAKCTYVNEISISYSSYGTDSADVITSRFFGIFFMVFQNTQIWGNLISFFLLKPQESESPNDLYSLHNSSLHPQVKPYETSNFSCGAEYCGGMNANLMPPSEDKWFKLVCIYLGSSLLACLIVFLFLDPLEQNPSKSDKEDGVFDRAIATVKHMRNTNQLLLIPLTIFNGMEQAFILGDYSKAYVACSWGVHNVGKVFICYGVVNASIAFFGGRLVKYVPRMVLMLTGAASNFVVCIALLMWKPNSEQYIYFFIFIGLWGLSDGIWLTQLNAFYGVLFRAEEEAAFANFKLWESVGFAFAFVCSIFLCITTKIFILLAFLVVGITGYIIVEWRSYVRRKTYNVSES